MYKMLTVIYKHPRMDMMSVLESIGFQRYSTDNIYTLIPVLNEKFKTIKRSKDKLAEFRWMMKELKKIALGNIPMPELAGIIQREEYNIE
jgi:glutamyl-tRNA(Gln) amidotransferase subunit E